MEVHQYVNQNVLIVLNAHKTKHVLTLNVLIHVQALVVSVLDVRLFIIIQFAPVPLVKLVIHLFLAS